MISLVLTWLGAASWQIFDLDKYGPCTATRAWLSQRCLPPSPPARMCSAKPNSPSHREPPWNPLPISAWVCTCLIFTYSQDSCSRTWGWAVGRRKSWGEKRNGSWSSTYCPFLWHCLVSLTTALFCQICFIFCMISSGWAFQAVISKFDLPL